ncbi:MAG: Holliday junction resolvase RuvX [Spirochaetes bacterium]|nr:Holliday junction resolvase RuvX [Spirochaetota bacterium]
MSVLVGIDFGESRIGVAVSDEHKKVAFPLGVIVREKGSFGFKKLKNLLGDRVVEGFVVGLPIRTNGTLGVEAEKTEEYIESLSVYFHKKAVSWDERYTTMIAANVLTEGGRLKDRNKVIDKIAAQIILQSYLDRTHKP